MYLLKCTNNGKYTGWFVAMPNSQKSYTKDITKAQVFETKESAEHSACGNEYPVRLENYLLGLKRY